MEHIQGTPKQNYKGGTWTETKCSAIYMFENIFNAFTGLMNDVCVPVHVMANRCPEDFYYF